MAFLDIGALRVHTQRPCIPRNPERLTNTDNGTGPTARLDRRTRENRHFAKRALYPSIDHDEATLYHAIRFPQEFFPVLYAMPRVIGWIARGNEMLSDSGDRTDRSRQIHVGEPPRPYVPIDRGGSWQGKRHKM